MHSRRLLAEQNHGRLSRLVQDALLDGHVVGAVVCVGNLSGASLISAVGMRAVEPVSEVMTADTIFDVASLTKVVATSVAFLRVAEHANLDLHKPVSDIWPEFSSHGKDGITPIDLMTHHSGLPARVPLVETWSGYTRAMELITEIKPALRGAYQYSDVNFLVLGDLVRRLSGLSLDDYCRAFVFSPLGLTDTMFGISDRDRLTRTAPTQLHPLPTPRGRVHDGIAARTGGVAGHAGLFSTADDLATFCRWVLQSDRQATNCILGRRMSTLMLNYRTHGTRTRGLGWDIGALNGMSSIPALGPRTLGHTGFTGTSLWIGLDLGVYVIVLANRLHPQGQGEVTALRHGIWDFVISTSTPAR